MSKVAGAVGAAGAGALGITGAVYLSRTSNFDSQLPEKLDIFEKPENLEGCVGGLFTGLKSMTPATTTGTATTAKIDSNFFEQDDKKETEGCLVINWKKNSYGENNNQKWKGNFRFLWSVKNSKSTKGFVVFAIAEPVKDKKLKWSGNVYSLEKTGDKKEWTVTKKASIKNGNTEGKEVDFKDKFPTPHTNITAKANWGWVSGEEEINNLCENGSCTNTTPKEEFFEGYWTWKGESKTNAKKLGEWTDKLDAWWKDTFGESEWNMTGVVGEITGEWSARVWYGIDKPEATNGQPGA